MLPAKPLKRDYLSASATQSLLCFPSISPGKNPHHRREDGKDGDEDGGQHCAPLMLISLSLSLSPRHSTPSPLIGSLSVRQTDIKTHRDAFTEAGITASTFPLEHCPFLSCPRPAARPLLPRPISELNRTE